MHYTDKLNFQGHATASSFGIVADWMNALHGASEAQDVLKSLVHLVRADAANLLRADETTDRIRYVARHDVGAGRFLTSAPYTYLREIMGASLHVARPGSIWCLSEVIAADDRAHSDGLGSQTDRPAISEALILTLATGKSRADFLEIQFCSEPLQHNLDLLRVLSGTLVTCWQRRTPLTVKKWLVRSQVNPVGKQSQTSEVVLLDANNPAGLSRAEFRVCSMLNQGMTVKVIAATLALSESTIRCHLSSIFSKTGATCQVELLGLMNAAHVAIAPGKTSACTT